MGTVIRKSGTGTGGGGTPTTSESNIWQYKNTNYTTSANALNVKTASVGLPLTRNVSLVFRNNSDDIVTADFSGNDDAIIPTAGKIYSISINMDMDVEVNDNTVELSIREGNTVISKGNIDSNKNVDTGYHYQFTPFLATASMVTNGLFVCFEGVTSGGTNVDVYNILFTIKELGTNV